LRSVEPDTPYHDNFLHSLNLHFVIEEIKKSEGGFRLSFETLEALVILGGEELSSTRLGAAVLLSASDYIIKDQTLELHHRLEVCKTLYSLASELTFGKWA
jgi:hypothetical protein